MKYSQLSFAYKPSYKYRMMAFRKKPRNLQTYTP